MPETNPTPQPLPPPATHIETPTSPPDVAPAPAVPPDGGTAAGQTGDDGDASHVKLPGDTEADTKGSA